MLLYKEMDNIWRYIYALGLDRKFKKRLHRTGFILDKKKSV